MRDDTDVSNGRKPFSFAMVVCTDNGLSSDALARVLALVAGCAGVLARTVTDTGLQRRDADQGRDGVAELVLTNRSAWSDLVFHERAHAGLPAPRQASTLRLLATAVRRQIQTWGATAVEHPGLRPQALRSVVGMKSPDLLAAALAYVHAAQSTARASSVVSRSTSTPSPLSAHASRDSGVRLSPPSSKRNHKA